MVGAGLVAPDSIDSLTSHPIDDLDDADAWSESDADEDVVTAAMHHSDRSSSDAGSSLTLVSPSRRLPAYPDADAKAAVCVSAYMLLNHSPVVLFHSHMQICNNPALKLHPVSSRCGACMLLYICLTL